VRHQYECRRVRVGGQLGQPANQILPPAQVEPGRRLVEQQQLGAVGKRAVKLDPLADREWQRTGRRVGDDAPSERESTDGRDCPFT